MLVVLDDSWYYEEEELGENVITAKEFSASKCDTTVFFIDHGAKEITTCMVQGVCWAIDAARLL